MGGPAWQFKKFADASSKLWFTQALKDLRLDMMVAP